MAYPSASASDSDNLVFRALSIQPKIPVISVGTSNGTAHFGLVRPEYSGPALKVVHCERSGHFNRSDRNVPFHLPKLLSPVPLFSILLTRVVTLRHPSKGGPVGTSSDDGIRRDPSRLRVVGLKLALCELVG